MMYLTVAVLVLTFVGGWIGGYYHALLKQRRPFPVTKEREKLETIVQALKGTPDSAQIILPNPVRTAFDEGKVNSMDDILI